MTNLVYNPGEVMEKRGNLQKNKRSMADAKKKLRTRDNNFNQQQIHLLKYTSYRYTV